MAGAGPRGRWLAADGARQHQAARAGGRADRADERHRMWCARTASPLQGYDAQRAVNDQQVILAAEITTESPDFGHLEPMVRATQRELHAVEPADPDVSVADAGHWPQRQIEAVSATACGSSFPGRFQPAAADLPVGTAPIVATHNLLSSQPPSRVLTAFGVFFAAEGLGAAWPGGDGAILYIAAALGGMSQLQSRRLAHHALAA